MFNMERCSLRHLLLLIGCTASCVWILVFGVFDEYGGYQYNEVGRYTSQADYKLNTYDAPTKTNYAPNELMNETGLHFISADNIAYEDDSSDEDEHQSIHSANISNNVIYKTDYTSIFHDYENRVDLRLIVLTYKRPHSLLKTLNSLQYIVTDGLVVSLEIWIDIGVNDSAVDPDTLRVAETFNWTNGPVNVHVNSRHMGLIGQWLYSWRPRLNDDNQTDTDEWAIYLEDDVDLSVYAYRWLRKAYTAYSHRADIASYCFHGVDIKIPSGESIGRDFNRPKNSSVFLFPSPSPWGIAPHPQKWREFQDWFVDKQKDKSFLPYCPAATWTNNWYKMVVKRGKADTVWTIWFLYYIHEQHLTNLYSNIPVYTGNVNAHLSSNRKEKGLHPNARFSWTPPSLLTSWTDQLIDFPRDPLKYGLDGKLFDE